MESDYSLEIDNELIDKRSCYPMPCYRKKFRSIIDREYIVEIPPNWWYGVISMKKDSNLVMMELKEELKREGMLYEVEYVLLNNSVCISGDVVYIEDYENTSLNDTDGKIHLIELNQDECDDVFYDSVNKIAEFNGTAYIAMVSNPSFIDKIKTNIPGVAISRYDGEKIKRSLRDNKTVIVETKSDSTSDIGTFEVYCLNENNCLTNYIYLIDLKEINKRRLFSPRGLNSIEYIWLRSWLSPLHPGASAFLISDMNSDTHHMYPVFGLEGDARFDKVTLKSNIKIPGFSINGTLGGQISKGSEVKLTLDSDEKGDVLSYNVIGEIPGSHEGTVIVSAHYDSYWGQCAMDNAAAVGAVWGVAKYIKDNGITPYYTIKFIAFSGEEYNARGSRHYVWKNVLPPGSDKIVAVINLDPIAMKTKDIDPDDPPIPLSPWIYPGKSMSAYWKILEAMKLENYNKITNYKYIEPHDADPRRDGKVASGDLGQFKDIDDTPIADYLIELERMVDYKEGAEYLAFFDHRSGENFQTGDVWTKVDTTDLYEIAKMTLRLVQLIAIDADLNFENDCSYTQLDLDNNGNYDSVKIDFDIITNISSGGKVESVIYQNGQAQTTPFVTNLLNLTQNLTTLGNLTVTLPPNATADNCDIRVYLRDFNGSQDDFDNSTIYLYPYNHSIANFAWELNDNNLKMVNFTDSSLPSPNAVLSSWNWSFGDGSYSTLKNCSHNYSSMGVFNATLTVTDSANKSANVTQEIETFNTIPVNLFNVSTNLVLVNKTVAFNSTSYDIDGSIENATWYFGDNTSGYGINTSHSYNKSGYYIVSLFATDNDNATVKLTKTDHILVVDALVDDGFVDDPTNHSWDTIQEGINDTGNDGIIYVYNGSYQSYLVNKSISVLGESRTGVIISSNDIGIDIQCVNVTIKNFTIDCGCSKGVNICGTSNCLIENGDIDDVIYGVFISSSNNNTIRGCRISNASTAGIRIYAGSMNNVVDDCDISDCYYGVGVHDSSSNWIGNPSIYDWYPNDCTFKSNTYSVYVDDSDHTSILGCDINSGNEIVSGRKGIYLDEASDTLISTCSITRGDPGVYIKDSRDSKIEFCKITNNINGVEFFGESGDNLITQNQISTNSQYGVNISTDDPDNNTIIYNDFTDNGDQLTNQSYDDRTSLPANNWYKTGNNTLTKNGSGEGNYWDDYTGDDAGMDGIGDTGYELDTGTKELIVDNYPLMESYGWCRDWE